MESSDLIHSSPNSRSPRQPITFGLLACACLVFASGAVLIGCGDDDGAQRDFGVATAELVVVSTAGDQMQPIEFQDPQGTVYTLTSAVLQIDELEFQMPEDIDCDDIERQLERDFSDRVECDDSFIETEDAEIKVEGPFLVDLMTGETMPELFTIRVPAIPYTEIDVEVTDSAELLLADNTTFDDTIRATADFEFEGNKRELQLALDFETETDIQAGEDDQTGFDIQEGDNLRLMLNFNNIFAGIPLTQCLREGDIKAQNGVVEVTDSGDGECADVEAEFESNFENTLLLEIQRDAPADGTAN